ncbi:MAG: T9SS type A sorting domain-containing protein [Bacteroidota bacterium]|nr:T9SS type A sorting domain-containing protein [Bacteroidota bacterium]
MGWPRDSNSTNVGALEYNTVCEITSTEEIKADMKKIVVYPNPCNSCTQLNFANLPADVYSFSIYSLLGEELAKGFVINDLAEIRTSLKGVFIIVVRSSNRQFREKIILN